MHVTAAVLIFGASLIAPNAAFWRASVELGLFDAGFMRVASDAFPCPQLSAAGARVPERAWELGVSWTRARQPRRARADSRKSARAVPLWTGPVRDDRWKPERCAEASKGRPKTRCPEPLPPFTTKARIRLPA